NAECLRVIHNQVALKRARVFQIHCQRCGPPTTRRKPVGYYQWSHSRASGLTQQLVQCLGIVMSKTIDRYAARRRPFNAPPSDWVDTFVHVDRDCITRQQPEEVPEKMQRRGSESRVLTTLQGRDGPCQLTRFRRLYECRRASRCKLSPGRQTAARVA